jgi:hypothetical protein
MLLAREGTSLLLETGSETGIPQKQVFLWNTRVNVSRELAEVWARVQRFCTHSHYENVSISKDGLLLGFHQRRREVSRRYFTYKTLPLVRPVAEGGICSSPAAAETHAGTPAKTKGRTCLIDNLEIAFHAQRTIIVHGYFCSSQEFLQDFQKYCGTDNSLIQD